MAFPDALTQPVIPSDYPSAPRPLPVIAQEEHAIVRRLRDVVERLQDVTSRAKLQELAQQINVWMAYWIVADQEMQDAFLRYGIAAAYSRPLATSRPLTPQEQLPLQPLGRMSLPHLPPMPSAGPALPERAAPTRHRLWREQQ